MQRRAIWLVGVLSLALGGIDAAVGAGRTVPTTVSPVSQQHPIEKHHSLTHPLDQSQVYWNFGGSTVLTKKHIRLTPSTQDRRGWLWNEYPIEADNFEVEFKLEVFSKPHFGGDGMGFWVLSGEQDPSFATDPEALSGPVFGMRNDFQGFGVLFDVYDNDNRRDNPAIFVLKHDDATEVKYNHDNDFANDMVTKVASGIEGLSTGTKHYTSYRCLGEFRNTGKVSKVLVKFLHKVLHVYIDTQDGVGYKFCLAVELPKSYRDHHIAFTAATGQVADNHDIMEVTTRYLADADKEIDDDTLPHVDSASTASSASTAMWAIIVIAGAGVSIVGAYEIFQFSQLKQIDAVRVCQQLNQLTLPHHVIHALLCALLLFVAPWTATLLNLPVLIHRITIYARTMQMLNPSVVATQSHGLRLWGTLLFYVLAELYYLHRFATL
jgi:hypothetical protein